MINLIVVAEKERKGVTDPTVKILSSRVSNNISKLMTDPKEILQK